MMLDFLGEKEAADALMKSIESVTAEGFCTPDLGGDARMSQVTDRIIERV
jgi:tartrate dehydrogenase/decarboxylase/D-malate dehydrogenase